MGTRIPSHQLKNGLLVSGRPENFKEKQPTMASRAVPYTGGDIKKSGELGKMFDNPVLDPPSLPKLPSRPSSSSQHNSGSVRSGPNSGPVKKFSGPMPLQPTGLITSGPLGSGPLGSGSLPRRSGQLDSSKALYGSAVTSLTEDVKVGFRVSRAVVWVVLVVVAMGLLVGGFLMVAVKKAIILVAVGGLLVPVFMGLFWNCVWGKRGLLAFVRKFPDAELRGAIDGQYVKVTGVVTCGSIPLESSFQRIPRCVYVSTELYEYKGCGGQSAHPKHRFFSWGSRYSEKYVADFYISDFQSGLRALVKAGFGAKVAPFVKPATVADVKKENRDSSPSFLRWLADRSLSSDDRVMRLKEGYIKEGSTVSVMGVVRRHDNVLMIVPPQEPVSTGCQWLQCLLPTYVEGLVLTCDDNQDTDVVPV
ncbi:Ubiquitin-specific protease family C19-related protein [Euphorbia peplus]|nr:Ubiquitin-specific protease family C19-related protein [Euphorbia peplus]